MYDVAANLRRLMARFGLTVEQVIEQSGLDDRTVRGILARTNKPHARTLHRLAVGLGVTSDELFQDPSLLAHRLFDGATNPAVDELACREPHLFQGWGEPDFAELYSRFGTGGELTPEGARAAVDAMNHNRQVQRQVSVLLESGEAELLSSIVQMLYERVTVKEEGGTNER